MKNLIFIVILGLFVSTANECEGQAFLKRMADKAKEKIQDKMEDKAEEKVDEKLDEKIDEAFEEAESEENDDEKSDEERGMKAYKNIMSRMGMDATPVEIEDSYSFSSNLKMDMENYSASGSIENKGYINSFFNQSGESFAYEFFGDEGEDTGKGFFIYDQKNNASIILSEKDGEKTGIVTGVNLNMEEEIEDMGDDAPDPSTLNQNLKKTGKTKTILGYKCNEYIYEDEEVISNIWMTKDKVWQTQNMFSAIYKSAQYSSSFPNGFMMEIDSKNKQTKERNLMKVTEINEKINKKVDLSDYNIMNMGSLNMDGMK